MQVARIVRRLRQSRLYSSGDALPQPTMSDIPAPKGSWQKAYDRDQQKYNRHLILGILTLGGTLAFGQYYGFHRMYNDYPESPADIKSYKE